MFRKLKEAAGVNPDQAPAQFVPDFFYNKARRTLTYLEKDCHHTSQTIPGSNIVLLLDPDDQTKVIGVRIEGVSKAALGLP